MSGDMFTGQTSKIVINHDQVDKIYRDTKYDR